MGQVPPLPSLLNSGNDQPERRVPGKYLDAARARPFEQPCEVFAPIVAITLFLQVVVEAHVVTPLVARFNIDVVKIIGRHPYFLDARDDFAAIHLFDGLSRVPLDDVHGDVLF